MIKHEHPTLEELELFCDIFDIVHEKKDISPRKIIIDNMLPKRDYKKNKNKIGDCIHKVNKWYDKTIIGIEKGTALKKTSEEGVKICKEIRCFLDQYENLPQKTHPTVVLGTTNAILTGLLPNPVRDFLSRHKSKRKNLDIRFVESDWDTLAKQVHSRDLSFAVGPSPPSIPYKDVYAEPLGPKIEAVVALHPEHKKWGERTSPLKISNLYTENILVLPDEEQPTIFNALTPDKMRGGKIIEMNNYTSIMSAVRMGVGVSIAPNWPEALDMFQVKYLPLKDGPTFQMAAYLRGAGRKELSEESRELLETIKNYVESSYQPLQM